MLAFRVLGPLSVRVDDREISPASVRQRRLLAALLLRVGRPVPMAALVEAAWGDRPPRSAVNSAQSHISRLRRLLGSDAVGWTGTGYVLRAAPSTVDAYLFESFMDQARSSEEPDQTLDLLDRALALWNDEAYPDLAHLEAAAAEGVRLAELQLTGRELRAEALLAADRTDEAVAALLALTLQHPLRERPWHALMLALHRAGRQADALGAFRRYEELLATYGLEPGLSVRQLHTAILATPETIRTPVAAVQDPVVRRGRQLGLRPAQLPAPIAGFTGRLRQLEQLDLLLAGDRPDALVIPIVAGTAGVGKTALALQWAYRVRDRFDDGQLFVDLRGYATGPPVRPIDALTGFLDALGIPPEQAPVRLDQATSLYRTLVAGRRMLIVLDNARDAEQVRPLLPGEPGCLVLITSRDRLGGLVARDGARPFALDALTPDEAGQLLTGLLGEARVIAEPGTTTDLARECAFLPLALRVAAATLVWQPESPIGGYVAQLRANRLTTLAIDGDPDSAVAVAFDASYRVLPAPARRLFRLLGLVPGPYVSAPAAAALAGLDAPRAAALLDRLAAAHLVDRSADGRYGCHDLLRCYAAERSARSDPATGRRAAIRRLYGWYLRMVDAAADLLYPHMLRLPRERQIAAPPPTAFPDHAAALAWLDTERENLVAAVRVAAVPAHSGDGPADLGWLIADALRGYFHLRRHASDWLAVGEAALAAAATRGNPRAEAAAQHSLGTAYRSIGDLPGARRHYGRALRLARVSGWREAEATIRGNLGIVCQGQGRLTAAVGHLTSALAIDRDTGRRAGVANNLGNLAFVYHDQGRLDEAAALFREALDLNRRNGSRHGQALALTGLGQSYRELGRLDDAAARLAEAMRHYTQVGDRDGQAVVHHCLAAVDRDLGRMASAQEHARAALALAQDTGDPRTKANALNVLGSTLGHLGRHDEARDCHQQAYEVAEELALPRAQIEALTGLADTTLQLGDLDRAGNYAQLALHRATRSGYRVAQGNAHATLARVELARGHPVNAAAEAQLALAVHRETGHRAG